MPSKAAPPAAGAAAPAAAVGAGAEAAAPQPVGAAAPVRWASSAGSGTPRSHEAMLRLHRAHFVERRGHGAALELIEERRQEGVKEDADLQREHRQQTQRMMDANSQRIKNMAADGSFSCRSKDEQDKLAEKGHNPDEAQRMAKQIQEHSSTYKTQKESISARVSQRPNMTVRPKEEVESLLQARKDPQEAAAQMTKLVRGLEQQYKADRGAMTERVGARPKSTFWPREQQKQMAEKRHDPDEAQEKLDKNLRDLARDWKSQTEAMTQRIDDSPAMSFRTAEERALLLEARGDPEEGRSRIAQQMQELERTHKDRHQEMKGRVEANPKQTFWTREERERMEARKPKHDDAREMAAAQMRELARAYREEKRGMMERVAVLPKKSFLEPGLRQQWAYAEGLRTMKPGAASSEAT
mmetsp:Transcript_68473/g.222843  ORF Transcript_68473/g.222843 Transcript_68473/m.222843 type:complete len:412 (-) Transcript_68473:76-1311(-)|eukprot:CAMPEP_0203926556 /NCGR_PEP_ID=MMETSP0359-20131031/66078_1 /ASSEMBLY_ACC=CAM_ASM_000338 /TAXON_ID=268821 /ORGANISM="Scrippsiella Hangoei, Strain SHTV-5" /LENGTH=411 /DNA_ID=CAMNT_0050855179 /DNA_START=42 /DNA_END=1277 /DNA_ORIENTATION=+